MRHVNRPRCAVADHAALVVKLVTIVVLVLVSGSAETQQRQQPGAFYTTERSRLQSELSFRQ